MSAITDALTQIRDEAHLNQASLELIRDEAQAEYDTVRTWPDSPTKREVLLQLGTLVGVYDNARREAVDMRTIAANALESMGGDVPPLPPTTQPQWHLQMSIESSPGLLPADAEFGRYYATEPLQLVEELCAMIADVAATNESIVSVKIGATTIATATFAPGETDAVVAVLEQDVPVLSLLSFVSPALQDPTLSGVVGTFVARRV